MTHPFTVRAVGASPAITAQTAVLASIPARFRLVDGPADILMGSCADIGVSAGLYAPKGLFLTDIGLASANQFQTLLSRAKDRAIVVASLAEHALTSDQIAFLRGDSNETPAIIDCRMTLPGDRFVEGALEQIALLEALAGPVSNLSLLSRTAACLILSADFGSWSGARLLCGRGKTSLQLNTVSRGLRRRLDIQADTHARPAELTVFDSRGSSRSSAIFEGGHRRSWLELHNRLSTASPVSPEIWLGRLKALERALLQAQGS